MIRSSPSGKTRTCPMDISWPSVTGLKQRMEKNHIPIDRQTLNDYNDFKITIIINFCECWRVEIWQKYMIHTSGTRQVEEVRRNRKPYQATNKSLVWDWQKYESVGFARGWLIRRDTTETITKLAYTSTAGYTRRAWLAGWGREWERVGEGEGTEWVRQASRIRGEAKWGRWELGWLGPVTSCSASCPEVMWASRQPTNLRLLPLYKNAHYVRSSTRIEFL